jgi:hypothetical protein
LATKNLDDINAIVQKLCLKELLIQINSKHNMTLECSFLAIKDKSSYRMLLKIPFPLKGEHLSIYFYFSGKLYTISDLLNATSMFVQCTFHGRAGHLYFVSRGILFFIRNQTKCGKRMEEVYPLHACLPASPHALTCLIQQRSGIMSSWKQYNKVQQGYRRIFRIPEAISFEDNGLIVLGYTQNETTDKKN